MENYEDTYNHYLKQYKKAITNDFNIEAICIIYAFLENELYKFLYLSGCINNKNSVTKRFITEYKEIWHLEAKQKFNLKKISIKRKYILDLLDFAENGNAINFKGKNHKCYFMDLIDKLNKNVDFIKVRNNFAKMEKWCNMRNKIIHGLLSKKNVTFDEEVKRCAENGLGIAEDLKDIVNKYENGTDLRIKYKIQDVK